MDDKENKFKPPRPSAGRSRHNGSNGRGRLSAGQRSEWTAETSSMNSRASSLGSGQVNAPEFIEFTPQRKGDPLSRLENAPKKSIRTHSKQHIIRKANESGEGRRRSMSNPRARRRSEVGDGKTTSISVSSNSRKGQRSSRYNNSSHHKRSRSVSQTRSTRSGRSTRSAVSAMSATSSLGTMEVEPNVHHNAILTTAIECEVIAEMKENELFARKAGINL